MMRHLILVCTFLAVALVSISRACDTAYCVSIVSKCLLIEACLYDFKETKNSTQMKNCQICLSRYYTDCCSCVGLCPDPDPEDTLTDTSSVEELRDPIPELFKVLTEEPDAEMRWTTSSYLVHYDALIFKPGHGIQDLSPGSRERERLDEILESKENCTVAFMSQCLSLKKCKDACKSMGAARYRWFHDHGCCQCVGSTCVSYGHNSPQCIQCPATEESNEVERDKTDNTEEMDIAKVKDYKGDKDKDDVDNDVDGNDEELDDVNE